MAPPKAGDLRKDDSLTQLPHCNQIPALLRALGAGGRVIGAGSLALLQYNEESSADALGAGGLVFFDEYSSSTGSDR